jgi:fatty-acid desaturase
MPANFLYREANAETLRRRQAPFCTAAHHSLAHYCAVPRIELQIMKIYNFYGYMIIFLYALACFYFAPAHLGPWLGLMFGMVYFLFFWFLCGLYLSDVIHMGIAHRALDYKEWFMKTVTILNNTFGLYVDPITWTNRHRLHHQYSDHEGDPNKLAEDGFWRTMYLCLMPYNCTENLVNDKIFQSWTFRITSNWAFALLTSIFNFSLLWWLAKDLRFTAIMWVGLRIFAVWVNMIQNYWTHDRRFGYRRYDDDRDNAMNIGEWLPVTATFSACLQNNHHHYPTLLRLSHHDDEYDFGFATVKLMKRMGLVKASERGAVIPKDILLADLRF